MMSTNTDDVRIQNLRELVVPEALIAELPAEGPLAEHVNASRMVIQSILEQTDDRLVVVVGPCSIHDPDAAMDYAARLKTLADEVAEDIFLLNFSNSIYKRILLLLPLDNVESQFKCWGELSTLSASKDGYQVQEKMKSASLN